MKTSGITKGYLFGLIITVILTGCDKFLDERTSHSSKVPSSLSDLRALMDAENLNVGGYPFLLEVWTDNYQIDGKSLSLMTDFEQRIYKFESPEIYPPANLGVWVNSYRPISVANIVMENLEKLGLSETEEGKNLKGQALFFRSFGHFMIAQVFSLPFDKNSDNGGMGIPLRHTSDVAVVSKRNTIKETYEDIIDDMGEAVKLLKDNNGYQTRPNKATAYAALSKIYLTMELYDEAEKASSNALSLYNSLIDLNAINLDARLPYKMMNDETIYFAATGTALLRPSKGSLVSPELIKMYEKYDLRLRAYFNLETNGGYSFKGDYAGIGSGTLFCGLTTSEVLLNRAECYVRNGKLTEARADLNLLLKHRIEKAAYKAVEEKDQQLLLKIILDERRKEFVNRSVRWLDLRRLNRDERFRKTVVRSVTQDGVAAEYKLMPEAKNYLFKIPKPVIDQTGMLQN